jgi:chaperonin GroES
MNIRPLHDRIIVNRLEEGEQQIGGIIIPDTAKEKPQQGTVIAVGHGKVKDDGKLIPLDVKAGDRILFGKYAGQEIKLDGEEYLIMKEDDVLAIVNAELTKKPTAIKAKSLTAPKGKSPIAVKGKNKVQNKIQNKVQNKNKNKNKNKTKTKSTSKSKPKR